MFGRQADSRGTAIGEGIAERADRVADDAVMGLPINPSRRRPARRSVRRDAERCTYQVVVCRMGNDERRQPGQQQHGCQPLRKPTMAPEALGHAGSEGNRASVGGSRETLARSGKLTPPAGASLTLPIRIGRSPLPRRTRPDRAWCHGRRPAAASSSACGNGLSWVYLAVHRRGRSALPRPAYTWNTWMKRGLSRCGRN